MLRTVRTLLFVAVGTTLLLGSAGVVLAQAKDSKARFYDFSDQLIDGEIKKPTALYMESRSRARFERLLKLKKSFRPAMIETSKERILK
jgi:hypothetical protein